MVRNFIFMYDVLFTSKVSIKVSIVIIIIFIVIKNIQLDMENNYKLLLNCDNYNHFSLSVNKDHLYIYL